MNRTCEFCQALRPAVYCKADAAHLCLSCDAKVHSANTLSSRHPRIVVCESCRNRPALVRCFNHQMFICRGCDGSLHDASSQHQRCAVGGYMGCPSAKDFATLWGFDLNDLGNNTPEDQFVSTSSMPVKPDIVNLDIRRQPYPQIQGPSLASEVKCMTSTFTAESVVGSSSQHTKAFHKGKRPVDTGFILQQILELDRLQLAEGSSSLSLRHGSEQIGMCSSKDDVSWTVNEDSDQHWELSLGLGTDIRDRERPQQELQEDPFPLSPSQLEQLTSSSNAGNPLHGDSFWHCKSPIQSSQFWSQNMQELGVCEEVGCLDDFNIPDVDLTFRNFDELFGDEQDQTKSLFQDEVLTCSTMEKDTSLERLKNDYARAMKDTSVASSVCNIHSSRTDEGLSAESSGADFMDNGISPVIIGPEPSANSADVEGAPLEAEENVILRYKERKKVHRSKKQVQYAPRKARADVQRRVGRFAKAMSM